MVFARAVKEAAALLAARNHFPSGIKRQALHGATIPPAGTPHSAIFVARDTARNLTFAQAGRKKKRRRAEHFGCALVERTRASGQNRNRVLALAKKPAMQEFP
jgi:hypothetical protein